MINNYLSSVISVYFKRLNSLSEKKENKLNLLKNVVHQILNSMQPKKILNYFYQFSQKIDNQVESITTPSKNLLKTVNQMEAAFQELQVFYQSLYEKLQVISQHTDTDEIKTIMENITDITHQIKQLSLNASIEASQANIYAGGFVIIAQEIDNLTMKTTQDANEIQGMMGEIQSLLVKNLNQISHFTTEKNQRLAKFAKI